MTTILLVEDEAIIALSETAILEGFGYRVKAARNGESAVELFRKGDDDIDLVLMDIDLGRGMDGTEAARQILGLKDVPIVFLTSHSERERVEKVRGITRYGYVIKNSGDFVLQTSIEMAFELFKARESLRTGEARLATLLKTIPDLVWLKDGEGVYLACNSTFERFFGASEEGIVGKTDYDFLPKDEADAFRDKDREAIAIGKPHSNEEWITFADDGHRAFLETIKTPMLDAKGRLVGVLGIGRDITERKRIEERLKESEGSIQRKLRAIVEPEGDFGELCLADIIDAAPLQALMDDFSRLTGMVTAILDTKGEILIATGWQDICTKFHRASPRSCAACTESDLFLSANMKNGEYLDYRCGNGLWDVVTPLYIEGRHVGNIYSGQFLYESDVVDRAAFAAQAERFGYDRADYLAALDRVPRFSRERISLLMDYLVRLTQLVSGLSYGTLRLARAMAGRRQVEDLLSRSVEEKELLLKELQHRVKNSLNTVSSLLRLNMAKLADEASRRSFQEAVDRVSCVSMVYDRLSRSAGMGKVRLDVYFADLIGLLVGTYAADTGGLSIETELAAISCDPARTVSLGLILNELLTNALKYAYQPGQAGKIRIVLSGGEGGAELRISDEGPGLPPGFDLKRVESLGLRIVGLLADELDGTLSFGSGGGTTAVVGFTP
jgi:PAS domain S-box-containing protein